MNDEDYINKYDDIESVAFVRNYLPLELKEKFTDNDIYYILDVTEEFYERSDFFETDEETEERELIEFIIRKAKREKIGNFTREDILFVLRGEEAYFEFIYGDMSE